MAKEISLKCFECGHQLSFEGSVSRRDECSSCGADVRVCKNCRFYDVSAYNECKETQADVIKEKNRSNFCDYFESGSGEGGNTKRDKLQAAADALFKKN